MSSHIPLESEHLGALVAFGQLPGVAPALGLCAPPTEAAWQRRLATPSGGQVHRLGRFRGSQLVAMAEVNCPPRLRVRHVGHLELAVAPDAMDALAGCVDDALDLCHRWLGLMRVEATLDAGSPMWPILQARGFRLEVLRRGHRTAPDADAITVAHVAPGWAPAPAGEAPEFPPRGAPVHASLRKATPADAAAFARVMRDERVAWGTLQLPSVTADLWRSILEKPWGTVFVAEVDGQVVGNAGVHPYAERSAHVAMLGMSLDPAVQGRGLGGNLMQRVLEEARVLGVRRLELDVYEDNARAMRLYERHGFVREGVKAHDVWRAGGFASTVVMARSVASP